MCTSAFVQLNRQARLDWEAAPALFDAMQGDELNRLLLGSGHDAEAASAFRLHDLPPDALKTVLEVGGKSCGRAGVWAATTYNPPQAEL